jgi:hypothetical protein
MAWRRSRLSCALKDDAQAVDDLKAMWEGMPFRASRVTVCFSFGLLDGRGLQFAPLQDDCGFPRR